MSIALMSQVWKLDMPSTRKMVLLALADNANDTGECFPSISMLSEKCSLCERAIQGHISTLQNDGYLTREIRRGRSTIYMISTAPTPAEYAPVTPAPHAPRIECTPHDMHPTPAYGAPTPPHLVHHTPAPHAPRTINNHQIEPSSNHQSILSPPEKSAAKKQIKNRKRLAEDFIPPDAWRDFASEKGLAGKEAGAAWHAFRDYHLAKGTLNLDWDAAWRTWVRNAVKFEAERQRRAKNG